MKLLFTRRRHLGSWLIRLVTWSEYSHVDILIGNTEADAFAVGAIAGRGVAVRNLSEVLAISSKATVMDLPVNSLEGLNGALDFLTEQLGKPYDWSGVFGIWAHRNWQEDDSWSCAELVAAVAAAGGYQPFDNKFRHRITPQDLFMLNFPKERLK